MCADRNAVALVVDDCQDNLFLMELILANGGYQIATACNGREGIAQASQLVPDIIILDMMMPDMSGSEVVQCFQTNPKLAQIPVILCTANKNISKEEVKGIVDICYKPFDIEYMIAKIDFWINCCRNSKSSTVVVDVDERRNSVNPQSSQLQSSLNNFMDSMSTLQISERHSCFAVSG